MEAWQKMETLRNYVSDEEILNELVQYLSSDDLDEFMEHCSDSFGVEYDEDEY